MKTVKFVCISDTHSRHTELTIPECDILIHCGDYSFNGSDKEIENFYSWLDKQPAKHLVSIQGNHEVGYEEDPENAKSIIKRVCPTVHLLEDSSVTLEGIKIYGTSFTPFFCNWAFQGARDELEKSFRNIPLMKDIWTKVPEDTEILIGHGMPKGILDSTLRGERVGDVDLRLRAEELKNLKAYIGGHLHLEGGQMRVIGSVRYYNAAICDDQYVASNRITEFTLDKPSK